MTSDAGTAPRSDGPDVVASRRGHPRQPLAWGPWHAEIRGDELAEIGFGRVILLRAIRAVVRDQDWNTVPARVTKIDRTDQGLTMDLTFDDGEIVLSAELRVRADLVRFSVDFRAVAQRPCATNRIGLVVLHPATDAGSAVTVVHLDRTREDRRWPVEISPHQPFVDVAGFEWAVDEGGVELQLGGDVFETEDQRNWTDASFKTYSTPLTRPFPVHNEAGDSVQQSAVLTVHGLDRSSAGVDEPDLVVVRGAAVGRVPPLSLGAAIYPLDLEPKTSLAGLTPGAFEAVLIELTGSPTRWRDLLAAAARQADALECALDVRVSSADADAVSALAAVLPDNVIRFAVFDPLTHITDADAGARAVRALRSAPHRVQIVGGTRAHFTELNRNIGRLATSLTALTFSLTPQMHASEVDHIIDSLPMQRLVASNACRLAQGRPVHVGPITLARRFNAVATRGPVPPDVAAERATDGLLPTDFAAAWTLGSVASLSAGADDLGPGTPGDRRAGVSSVCYFETSGPRGIAFAGGLTPAGQVLDRFARRTGWFVLDCLTPERIAVLAVRDPSGGVEVSLGDLSGRARSIRLRPEFGDHDQIIDLGPWQVRHVMISNGG